MTDDNDSGFETLDFRVRNADVITIDVYDIPS